MGGNVLFEDALRARLDIMKPSRKHLQEFEQHPPTLTPGVKYEKTVNAGNVW